jgi:hypothetical protein
MFSNDIKIHRKQGGVFVEQVIQHDGVFLVHQTTGEPFDKTFPVSVAGIRKAPVIGIFVQLKAFHFENGRINISDRPVNVSRMVLASRL